MIKTLNKTIKLLKKTEKKEGIKILILVIGNALLETLGVASIMPFLAVLGNPVMITGNPALSYLYELSALFGVKNPYQFLIVLGVLSFTLIVISAIYRTLTNFTINNFIEMRRHLIGERLLEIYLYQPYAFFLNRNSSDLAKTILSEVDQLVGSVFRPAFNMVAYSFVLIALCVLLIWANPLLAAIVSGLLGVLYAIVFLGLRKKITTLGVVLVNENKKRFLATNEAFGGIKIIKLLGRERDYLKRFQEPSESYAKTQSVYETLSMMPHYLIESIIFGAMLLITIILLIEQGGLSGNALGILLPTIGLYAFASYRLKPAIHNIYHGFASLRYGREIVKNISFDLNLEESKEKNKESQGLQLRVGRSIELMDLAYTYPESMRPTIKDINITIPFGSSLGLVGSTGAGKTTLVDLILGLLTPSIGLVKIDGVKLSIENMRAWQKNIGYVPQDIFLADSTLLENIAMGIPKMNIDYEQVVKCAKMAQVHEFIQNELPEKYETLVGERGVRLSGGQRQRIGIARALYQDPEILVFDEATSALDNLTEKAVMDAVEEFANKKIIIIIAHRLSTVKKCDKIIYLESGNIKAAGTYEELEVNSLDFKKLISEK